MNIIRKLHKFNKDKDYRDYVLLKLATKYVVSDKLYLKYLFKKRMGYKLDLKNPKTFNEKLQWLKLYDRNPEYTKMVDKIQAKEYVSKIIGPEHIIPTLGVWNDPSEINYDELPDQFVIKCNHNSGTGMYICKDKSKMDINAVNEGLRKGLNENFYKYGREWPYKNVKPRIIAETLLSESNFELYDYKLMCFGGKVKCTFVCSERHSGDGLKVTFFDNEWKRLPFIRTYPSSSSEISKPKHFSEMIKYAEILGKDLPFVRVDFYEINDIVYFGELTFYPGCGFEGFKPIEWDLKLGDYINLPNKKRGKDEQK